jgi:GTP-binding protein LepA
MASNKEYEVSEVGVVCPPDQVRTGVLRCGDVGYVTAAIRDTGHARVGDTVTTLSAGKRVPSGDVAPLPGYAPPRPMVFCGLYPVDAADYDELKDGIEKLRLSDAAISFAPENSDAFGAGFRCGFLGLLHVRAYPHEM